jgi:hypothetical protein
MHGSVNVQGHDPRLDLEALPDCNLFDLSRNPDAIHRKLALHILFERDSALLKRPELAEEVRQYRLDNEDRQ